MHKKRSVKCRKQKSRSSLIGKHHINRSNEKKKPQQGVNNKSYGARRDPSVPAGPPAAARRIPPSPQSYYIHDL
ncbi:hypothetical protein EYF80_050597 [Liparis tanakae]|uniref:Uncharacterized protein n=1 Tax=Liparis tanakae TaxID=230148 RepID=A0A4Z2FDM6_9TELE|nr:hypothetical protein EYF80_050597 [Liparis tanakae]